MQPTGFGTLCYPIAWSGRTLRRARSLPTLAVGNVRWQQEKTSDVQCTVGCITTRPTVTEWLASQLACAASSVQCLIVPSHNTSSPSCYRPQDQLTRPPCMQKGNAAKRKQEHSQLILIYQAYIYQAWVFQYIVGRRSLSPKSTESAQCVPSAERWCFPTGCQGWASQAGQAILINVNANGTSPLAVATCQPGS